MSRSCLRLLAVSIVLVGASCGDARADSVTLTPSLDTTIFNNGENSNGSGQFLFVGQTQARAGNIIMRSLVRFDLSSIPPGSEITGATLTFRLEQAGNAVAEPHTVHRVLADWGEGASIATGGTGAPAEPGDATWTMRVTPGMAWQNIGGDFTPVASGSTTISSTSASPAFAGTGLVADIRFWLDNPAANFGWMIRGNEAAAGSARKLASRQLSVESSRPRLQVQFTPPTSCPADFNGVGGVSVQDVFDFLGAWFEGDARADFNGAGGVTVQDIFDYLAAWFTPC